MTKTLQQKIDSLFHYQYYCEDCEGIVNYEGHDSNHSIKVHEVIRLPLLNKALQEFREQIEKMIPDSIITTNDEWKYDMIHNVLALIGEKT